MINMLKLGGSLITDKNKAHTAREDVIAGLSAEIRKVYDRDPSALIIGHGSGSFGHFPAKKYGTRNGVHTEAEKEGFLEVHREALSLNEIVLRHLREAGIPCIPITPLDCITAAGGNIISWDVKPVIRAMGMGIVPVVFGDTVFDEEIGGTIVSTEEIFCFLCDKISEKPSILLAGLEEGVWKDYPNNTILQKIIPVSAEDSQDGLGFIRGSEFTDVTGGMAEKVRLMQKLVREGAVSSAQIFSGERGNILLASYGHNAGTMIIAEDHILWDR